MSFFLDSKGSNNTSPFSAALLTDNLGKSSPGIPLIRQEFNWRRTSHRNPCPVCGSKDWCEVSDDGLVVHCMRQRGDKEVNWRGGGWLHFFGDRTPGIKPVTLADLKSANQVVAQPNSEVQKVKAPLTTTNKELAPSETRAAAISYLLNRLELSPEHQAYLESENMLQIAATTLSYRTLPGDLAKRRQLLNELDELLGGDVAGSLGFVYERVTKGDGRCLEFAGVLRGVDALLIPVRDLRGWPIALKARSVHPDTQERIYRAMSAGNTDLGAGVGTPIHVARPAQIASGMEKWLIVTEGEKKADYAAHRLGVVTLGLQGVGNWRSGKLLPLLKQLEVEHVVEAFDADRADSKKRGSYNIERQANLLSEQCAAAGYKVYTALWSLAEGKGLDDFLRTQEADDKLAWPELFHFSPPSLLTKPQDVSKLSNEATTPDAEAEKAAKDFQRRYGITQERARRIAGQFVEVDANTHIPADSLLDKTGETEVTLTQARDKLAHIFGKAFTDHIITQGTDVSRILLRTTTGTGKTTAALNQIVQHLTLGRPGRVLYLTDTKLAYAYLFGPGKVLEEHLQAGRVAIREGRTHAPGIYHCERYDDCQVLGSSRQPASADACGACPFGSPANWKKYATNFGFDPQQPRLFECEKNGYLASVKLCKTAQVVIAPKAAVLNGSEELAEFDFIIIDEDTVSFLLECQTLTTAQIDEWEQGRRLLEAKAFLAIGQPEPNSTSQEEPLDYFDDDSDEAEEQSLPFDLLCRHHTPFDKLFALVQAALTDYESSEGSMERVRFKPLLEARAVTQKVDLDELINDCMDIRPSKRFKRYRWEKPYRNHLAGVMIAPLRFARDLIEMLDQELDVEEGGDTRLWVERLSGGAAVLRAYLPRQHLIDILSGNRNRYSNELGKPSTVFFLDATAGPIFRLALPNVEEVEIKVPQPIYILQTTNSLYTGRSLGNDDGKALAKISLAVEALVRRFGATKPVVFSRKAFNPDFNQNTDKDSKKKPALNADVPGIRYGHYERHNKGLDDYADADLLAIVGHYSQPLNEIIAQVQAFRGCKGETDKRGGGWQLKAYGWRGAEGKGLARWCKANPDPEIQAAIEHSTVATVMQTIGRGRAALRSGDKPLLVVVLNSMPLPGLLVNELTDVSDILEQKKITEKQATALTAGREEANARRQIEALERINAVKQELSQSGQEYVPAKSFAFAAAISRGTLCSFGYGVKGRWIKTGEEIPNVLPQALFISLLSKPALLRAEFIESSGEKVL